MLKFKKQKYPTQRTKYEDGSRKKGKTWKVLKYPIKDWPNVWSSASLWSSSLDTQPWQCPIIKTKPYLIQIISVFFSWILNLPSAISYFNMDFLFPFHKLENFIELLFTNYQKLIADIDPANKDQLKVSPSGNLVLPRSAINMLCVTEILMVEGLINYKYLSWRAKIFEKFLEWNFEKKLCDWNWKF